MKTLITGGIRSGKSRFALNLAIERSHQPKCFIATAEALDDEMRQRIERHKAERSKDFVTLEESVHLAKALAQMDGKYEWILLDCLTLWVSNLLHHYENRPDALRQEIKDLMDFLPNSQSSIIFVTNEVGFGIVPMNAMARLYVDQLGMVNQQIATLCDEVVLMVSGIPQWIKMKANLASLQALENPYE